MDTIGKNEKGIALVVIIMLMAVLTLFTGAGLLFSGLNLRTASYLKTGNLAFYAADSGIQHAVRLIPNGTTFPYTTETPLLNSVPLSNDYTYTVTAINGSGGTKAILTSTGKNSNGARRVIKAYIARSVWTPPGAIYLPGEPQYIETRFNGSSFQVNGNDANPGGAPGSGAASPVPGISTSAGGTTTEIIGSPGGSLSSTQYSQIAGLGGSPSVRTSSTTIDVNQLATDLIASGVEGIDRQTLPGGSYTGGEWGTSTLPKITHITGDGTVTGVLTGWGVLIVDGNLSTRGNFTFSGLVILRGEASIHGSATADESATIHGAVLINESPTADSGNELEIGGSGKVYYSSQAIAKVVSRWSLPFSTLPSPAKLISWQEVME